MARWYARKHGNNPTNRIAVRLAGLQPYDTVVDIGCGPGLAVREAARQVKHGEAIGVDPSMPMLEIASKKTRSHAGRIEYRKGKAEKLPVADASVMVALAINSLHHWENPARGFAEVERVLVPGGRILIVDEAGKDGKCAHGEGPLADPKTAVRMLRKRGFTEVSLVTRRVGRARIFVTRARRPR